MTVNFLIFTPTANSGPREESRYVLEINHIWYSTKSLTTNFYMSIISNENIKPLLIYTIKFPTSLVTFEFLPNTSDRAWLLCKANSEWFLFWMILNSVHSHLGRFCLFPHTAYSVSGGWASHPTRFTMLVQLNFYSFCSYNL